MRTNTADKISDISMSQLEEVFATFNQVSAELGCSYKELEGKVSGLSEELAATHSARLKELTEKEMLAAKLSALMDALPGGVIAIDAKGIIKEENPAAIEILDRSFLGYSWLKALEFSASVGPLLDGEISCHNGKRVSISSSAYGDEGNIILLLTDISENYRLNTIINREQRLAAMGEMAARLAHQVRTPLSSAILYLSHISSTTITKKILDRLRQIEKLIDGMLSYIRGEGNSNQEFSLNKLLGELKKFSALQLRKSEGELIIDCPDYDCSILGNQEALFNALSNLIENAIQVSTQKPLIKISLNRTNGYFNICVEDNGPGIDDKIKDRVFDPFFSTRPMGTGLGLAVVSSVIKAHDGEIYLKSAEGGGTIFQVLLPDIIDRTDTNSGMWGDEPFSNNNLVGYPAKIES